MSKDKLGKEPAFPTKPKQIITGQITYNFINERGIEEIGRQNQFSEVIEDGMSKRLYIATMAMQGLIAVGYTDEQFIAQQAFIQADKLLELE